MNGHTENKKNTYAHLDRLSTEALEELLCADIKSPDDDDDEVVLHILEVIEQREKPFPLVVSPMWTRRWRNFRHTTISLR